MTLTLRIDEVAKQKDICVSDIIRNAGIPITTARRMWHSSATGSRKDRGTLKNVSLVHLAAVADYLGVEVQELIVRHP